MDTDNLVQYGSEEDTWTPFERKELLCQMAATIASGNIRRYRKGIRNDGIGYLVLDAVKTSKEAIQIAKEIMKELEKPNETSENGNN